MKISVKYFAICREITGRDEEEMELNPGASGVDFWDAATAKYPALAEHRSHSRLAINMEYVSETVKLQSGDELCIIPPVSGG